MEIPRQQALIQFLGNQLPPLDKKKKRVVLLDERLTPLTIGVDIVSNDLLTLPRRFAPIDYIALSGFQEIWLVMDKGAPPRLFDGSLFTVKKIARTRLFGLFQMTIPGGLSFTEIAGNPGGNAYSYLCPDNGAIIGFSVTTGTDGILSAAPICRDGKGREKNDRIFGDLRKETPGKIVCPAAALPQAIVFYADRPIRGIGLICPTQSKTFDPATQPSIGRTDGSAMTRTCQNGTRPRGLYGSSGALLDSIGLICGK